MARNREPDPDTAVWLAQLAANLKAVRVGKPLTIREAAETAGVSPTSIQRAECGTADTGADMLRILAAAYDVTVCSLLPGGEEKRQPPPS